MTVKTYDIEESNVVVLHSENSDQWNVVWAIFDVSQTIYSQWIAVCWYEKSPQESRQPFEMLTIFDGIDEMLLWVAHRQMECGDEIRSGWHSLQKYNEMEFLNRAAQDLGYIDWKQFCKKKFPKTESNISK